MIKSSSYSQRYVCVFLLKENAWLWFSCHKNKPKGILIRRMIWQKTSGKKRRFQTEQAQDREYKLIFMKMWALNIGKNLIHFTDHLAVLKLISHCLSLYGNSQVSLFSLLVNYAGENCRKAKNVYCVAVCTWGFRQVHHWTVSRNWVINNFGLRQGSTETNKQQLTSVTHCDITVGFPSLLRFWNFDQFDFHPSWP